MKRLLYLVVLISFPIIVTAQKFNQERMDKLAAEYAKLSFPMLQSFLSIPNVADNHADIEKNVQWCEREFKSRGFATTRIETSTVPLLLAERKHKKAKKTLLVYLQLDGQPVDTSQWDQEHPFIPALKKQNEDGRWAEIPWDNIANYEDEWRIFARAASDAKGPVMMFLMGLDITAAEGFMPNYNLKVIMDFEEEIGSPRLPGAVKENMELLKSDMLIIFDGPRHLSNKPTLAFGARGIAEIGITTYGPVRPQHSGHYGNYAPNPALRLAQLLASMKDEDGRVTIPGFYDGIEIDAETEKLLRAVPDDEKRIKEYLQIGSFDKVGSYYQEALQFPSLNIRGMQSGWINEEARTIVPAWAKAEIDVRLVLESDPERLINLIKNHIEQQGFYVTDHAPTKEERMKHEKVAMITSSVSYQSFRTDFNTEVGQWLRKAMNRAFGEDPVMIRTMGGSIPISPFVNTLGIPAVAVPTVNRDNNQHSPNENLRLGNYRDGIKTMVAILTEKL
ncbi:MAG: M20/M25/M40 family metallo-hydrolase [Bacteroidota bacterium]